MRARVGAIGAVAARRLRAGPGLPSSDRPALRHAGRRRVAAFLVFVGLAFPAAVLAAAPGNDSWKTPAPIGSLPFSAQFDLTEATDDTGLPACEAGAHRRVWYSYTAPADQVITASVGGNESAEIALWTVTKPTIKGLQLSACGAFGADLVGRLVKGTSYLVSVGDATLGAGFAGTLHVVTVPRPPNDAFADATLVTASPFSVVIDRVMSLAA